MSKENKVDVLITQVVVLPRGEPLYSQQALFVSVEDEAAGPFLTIKSNDDRTAEVAVNIEEIDSLKAAMAMICDTIGILDSHTEQ